MSNPASKNLVIGIVLLLLAVVVFLPAGAGPGALPREMAFVGGLHDSLYYLDQAKSTWAQEKHKPDGAIPTMDDLAPYLGDSTNRIKRFVALGVKYKISAVSELEHQSDVATLTRGLRFQIGFCRYYPAGTSYCIHTGWSYPRLGMGSWLIAFYEINRGFFALSLFALAFGNVLLFVIKKVRNLKQGHVAGTLNISEN